MPCNAGNGIITCYKIDDTGRIALLSADGQTAAIGRGSRDIAISADSRYCYVFNSILGTISSYAVQANGNLTSLGEVGKLPVPGGNGLVAR